jgi:hypothetical protein
MEPIHDARILQCSLHKKSLKIPLSLIDVSLCFLSEEILLRGGIMFKSKISSTHFLALLSILNLFLFISVGQAQTVAAGTSTDTGTVSTSTPSSSTDASTAMTPNQTANNGDGQNRDFHRNDRRRQNMRIFYLGVCSGQVLAQQGTYLSDIASGSTTANPADLKTAIKAAIQTCRQQARANGGGATASPTPVPSATPTGTPTGSSTTTASES